MIEQWADDDDISMSTVLRSLIKQEQKRRENGNDTTANKIADLVVEKINKISSSACKVTDGK